MVLEEDQTHDGGFNSAGDNMSDQKQFGDDVSDDANTADKISQIDGTANRPDSVADAEPLDTDDALAEKSDQLENGEQQRHHVRAPSASPSRTDSGSGNGVRREDDVTEGKLSASAVKIEPEVETRRVEDEVKTLGYQKSFLLEPNSDSVEEDESGTEEEQAAFMKELEAFHRERFLEFKPPRFYGEPLNCLKLWRSVIRHGGYEQVTAGKVWRQVGESFKPPKTCTTVSWTFRCFYEKALLEYEKFKISNGDLPFADAEPSSVAKQTSVNQTPGSGRATRVAAARAMQGWHSRLHGNGEVGEPIIKDKTSSMTVKREKQGGIGLLKRKKPPSPVERTVKLSRIKSSKQQLDSSVVDVGLPADWVKINVQRTKDCFEVYALVPGLLREEVRVQSDPAGRLVISGQPEQLDNPWGVSPFKKVVSLPSRIDPHQTSAVVTLHGQLFVRVPFEQPLL